MKNTFIDCIASLQRRLRVYQMGSCEQFFEPSRVSNCRYRVQVMIRLAGGNVKRVRTLIAPKKLNLQNDFKCDVE